LSVLLAKTNLVTVLDIDLERVNKINSKKSTIEDPLIDEYLLDDNLNIKGTTQKQEAYDNADIIIVCTPTNFDHNTNSFDTESVDSVVKDVSELNKKALIVIKSTIPIGHTDYLKNKFNVNIIFSPEFLREGNALYDNLYPSRVIVGGKKSESSVKFGNMLVNSAIKKDIKLLFMNASEAEAVKLFSNTYLAMRVSFFNELDSFAFSKNLNAKDIIEGLSFDSRIGKGYNNPSFGYGGYCLPKDTKQLLYDFGNIPNDLISAIVSSNETRKKFMADEIMKTNPDAVGFFRLIMKEGSDNFRSSSIIDILEHLRNCDIKVIIYEPTIKVDDFNGVPVEKDINKFKRSVDIIVANRKSAVLDDVKNKLFTRDIFNIDQ